MCRANRGAQGADQVGGGPCHGYHEWSRTGEASCCGVFMYVCMDTYMYVCIIRMHVYLYVYTYILCMYV